LRDLIKILKVKKVRIFKFQKRVFLILFPTLFKVALIRLIAIKN